MEHIVGEDHHLDARGLGVSGTATRQLIRMRYAAERALVGRPDLLADTAPQRTLDADVRASGRPTVRV